MNLKIVQQPTVSGACFRQGLLSAALLSALLVIGCKGFSTSGEKSARNEVAQVNKLYQPLAPERLPVLKDGSALSEYLRFAMLNQPRVGSAYYDWVASVEKITVERSLPDPQLTFETDIADMIMTVMPGLMMEFPGPGKLKAAAAVATAESQGKYFAFENTVLQTAFALKQTYYQLWFLDEKIRISRRTLELLADLEKTARVRNESGQATLQDVYRAQIEQDQLTTELENLLDSRRPLMAQFKGALGLRSDREDPPFPARLETTPLDLNGEDLLKTAFARNPRLKEMEAEVRMAEAAIAVARKSRIPDFTLGLEADAKAAPTMFRPQAGMTLPIWRDKIAAQIAGAKAGKHAAGARLANEQIMVSVDFAMKTYDYREVTRALALLQDKLIPKAEKSLEIARAGYLSGRIDFFNLIDSQRTLLDFQMSEVEARTKREVVLADLSLTIAGIAPEGAPLLAGTKAATESAVKTSDKSQR